MIQKRLAVHKFVKTYNNCPDSIITYASGKEWYGLKQIKNTTYQWGDSNKQETEGFVVYREKGKPLGKGSIVRLEGVEWIIANIKYKNPPVRVGNPVPLPQEYDMKVFLKKKCNQG